MPRAHGHIQLAFPAEFVFAQLCNPSGYKDLLPEVIRESTVVREEGNKTILALTVGKKLIHISYQCEITWIAPMRAEVRLLDGPFKHMTALADISPAGPSECRAEYSLDCTLHPDWLEALAQKIFDRQLQKALFYVQEVLAKKWQATGQSALSGTAQSPSSASPAG